MSSVNAIILNKDCLNFEILFTKVSKYIEISLKSSNISNVFFANDFNNITDEMLNSEYVIFIDAVAPEIVEYDELIESHISNLNDITYFASKSHSHSDGVLFDENNVPCAFGCSDDLSKIDIFIMSCDKFKSQKDLILNPFSGKLDFVMIAENTIIFDASDIATLTEDFKEAINFSHINNGVFIIDPNNTYISSGVEIGAGTQILPGSIIKGATKIGCNCIIGPNAYISNSLLDSNITVNSSQVYDSQIGNGTTVGPFSYVRPQSQIGQNVKIGDFVEVKKATIGDGTKISHLTYIGDAIVGKNVNFGCGTVVVNYDGFNKYQTIVEDNAFIGCNTNLVSPVKIGKGVFTAAGSTITKDIPQDALGVARVRQENKPLWAKKFRELKSKK